jgi:hypothetical protein
MSDSRVRTVLWKRNDVVSLERCTLSERIPTEQLSAGWPGLSLPPAESNTLSGTVLTAVDYSPAEIRYDVVCTEDWQTRAARVRMQYGNIVQELEVHADRGRWWRNGQELPELNGLSDIDLGFTPSTNTLPIRRCALDPGDSIDVTAVWVRFPDLAILTLPQRYTRGDAGTYRYESRDGEFTAELEVDDAGLIITYDKYWQRIAEYPSR